MDGVCVRPGCSGSATAVVRIERDATRAALLPIGAGEVRGDLALCAVHARRFSVPLGWVLDDEWGSRVGGAHGPSPSASSGESPGDIESDGDEEPQLLIATSRMLSRAFSAAVPHRSVLSVDPRSPGSDRPH